jgi:hypothetical membrane protein
MERIKLAGLLYFLGASVFLMGIITAEALYPTPPIAAKYYTTYGQEISDLGSTKPPNSVHFEPSSTLFSLAMLLGGLMVLTASFLQHLVLRKWVFSIPALLFGLGLTGVGLFRGDVAPYHGMSAMLAFLMGGICGITSLSVIKSPFKWIGVAFGGIALAAWVSAVFAPWIIVPVIGIGGTERWVAYPLMLWLAGLGGYLMNGKDV